MAGCGSVAAVGGVVHGGGGIVGGRGVRGAGAAPSAPRGAAGSRSCMCGRVSKWHHRAGGPGHVRRGLPLPLRGRLGSAHGGDGRGRGARQEGGLRWTV